MIKVEKFQPWHIDTIDAQDSQRGMCHSENAETVAEFDSWTVFLDDKIVACCGCVPIWHGRNMLWSQISKTISPKGMVLLTRAVKRYLDLKPCRTEAYIVEGHEAGHRWIKLLGFTLDTPMPLKNILPNGESAYLYSRVL